MCVCVREREREREREGVREYLCLSVCVCVKGENITKSKWRRWLCKVQAYVYATEDVRSAYVTSVYAITLPPLITTARTDALAP